MGSPNPKNIRYEDFTDKSPFEMKIVTRYAVDEAQREAQVKSALARKLPCIVPETGVNKDEPIAVVCYGPSINQTWEKIKNFKTVISMSGSHQFLIDKGITPTYHIECDPRSHKKEFLKNPQKGTIYYIASTCHPDVFDALKDYDLRTWHIYGNERMNDLPYYYPRGEWILTGGSNVGLRALVIAAFLGYKEIHLFGMDCSFPDEKGSTHAGHHPNTSANRVTVKVGNKKYYATQVMIEYAQQFFHEMEKLPGIEVHMYGDGLLQNMAANKLTEPIDGAEIMLRSKHKPQGGSMIGLSPKLLVTADHIEKQKKLHAEDILYGSESLKRAEAVAKVAKSVGAETILDYGCGKGELARHMEQPIWEYDPCVPGKDNPPREADLIVCTEVLEYVEPELLNNVIVDMRRLMKKICYVVIKLSDGKHPRLNKQTKEWWVSQLSNHFEVGAPVQAVDEIHLILGPAQKHGSPPVALKLPEK